MYILRPGILSFGHPPWTKFYHWRVQFCCCCTLYSHIKHRRPSSNVIHHRKWTQYRRVWNLHPNANGGIATSRSYLEARSQLLASPLSRSTEIRLMGHLTLPHPWDYSSSQVSLAGVNECSTSILPDLRALDGRGLRGGLRITHILHIQYSHAC